MLDTNKIFSYAHFTEQLSKFWEEYGLIWLSATIVGGITIGLVAHYFNHTAPMAKVKHYEKKEEECETEEELEDEEIEEPKKPNTDGNAGLDRHLQTYMGRAGIIKGSINRNLISCLPKRSYIDKSERGLAGAMADIEAEREELLNPENADIPSNITSMTYEEEQADDVDEVSESEIEEILTEGILADEEKCRMLNNEIDPTNCLTEHSERDLVNMLGNLHGKLATAQLRAKTRKMAQDMSAEERQTEADMKARQLESIMNLMLKNQEKFGLSSDEVKEQLNLYNF